MALAAAIATYELARLANGAGHLANPILPVLMALVAFAGIRLPAHDALALGALLLMFVGLGWCVLKPATNSITGSWARRAPSTLVCAPGIWPPCVSCQTGFGGWPWRLCPLGWPIAAHILWGGALANTNSRRSSARVKHGKAPWAA